MLGKRKQPIGKPRLRPVSPVNAVLSRWQETDFYIQLNRELERDYDANMIRTIKQLHADRTESIAKVTTSNALALNRNMSGWRSRLTAIEQTCLSRHARIENLAKRLRKAIIAGDASFLSELARNAAEKDAIIDTLLADANDRMVRYEIVREFCRLEIADLDKSSWTVTAYLEELKYEREQAGR